MQSELDAFSRTFDKSHYDKAIELYNAGGKKGDLKVHTYELYDKAFLWPRIRRYPDV